MADRIYPSAKPNAPQPPPPNAAAPAFPATKGQTYGRPMYRPQPGPFKQRRRRRSGRSCCCSCCLWLTLILVAAIFLAAIAGGAFYVLYRPHRPSFSVSSLRLAQLNLTSSPAAPLLTSRLDLSLTARNPNNKIDFLYDPISISVSSPAGPDGGGGGLSLGEGSFPSFLHEAKNTTVLRTTVASSGQSVDSSAAADLRKRSTVPLRIELDTRAGVKVGKLRTKRVGIRVSCQGFDVSVPKKKGGAGAAATPDVRCEVKLRIKIWKWTF